MGSCVLLCDLIQDFLCFLSNNFKYFLLFPNYPTRLLLNFQNNLNFSLALEYNSIPLIIK